jgi:hypothetical protein
MQTVLLTLLLALTSTGALAEWVLGGETENATWYYDPDTIRVTGSKVKMWTLADYKTALTAGRAKFLSTKTRSEFDCADEQVRILYTALYAGQKGAGDTVSSSNVSMEWEPVAPGTTGESLLQIACSKR